MVGPEGHRFLQEINTFMDGSPTHISRMISYGLANQRTRRRLGPCERCLSSIYKDVQLMHFNHRAMSEAALGRGADWQVLVLNLDNRTFVPRKLPI